MAPLLETLGRARTVGVVGFGREGASFLRFCAARGLGPRFVVIDDRPLGAGELADFPDLDLVSLTGTEALAPGALDGIDMAFRSPGVSIHRHPVLRRLGSVPMATSINLWCELHPRARWIAVSGTKGKSTTAALLHHALAALGCDVALGGNIGVAPLDIVPGKDYSVLELSSYQIADLAHAPHGALVLNLYPEHVDWHGDLDRYYRDKCRLIAELAPNLAIVSGTDETLKRYVPEDRVTGRFGVAQGFHVEGDEICFADTGLGLATRLRGRHNRLNICAVLEMLHELGLLETGADLPQDLRRAIADFRPLPHRLEELGEGAGRLYVNDSISTTPESVLAALAVYRDRPVTLLLGGYDREQDYAEVIKVLKVSSVRAVLTLPDNGARIAAAARAALGDAPPCLACASLEEAMAHAVRLTPPGGVVLLSPGAPSYGRFRNFEERGDRFRALAGLGSAAAPVSGQGGAA